jgi:SAM-dependent methyltransferase
LPFGQFAAEYDAGRPGYPNAALDWLLEEQDGLVVDLGAGSGKLTEQLAARCTALLAVEPDTAMLQHLKGRLPGVPAVQGSAESLPVATGSVQTLLVAQAWHWFDAKRALREVTRVVKCGGRLGLLWNAPSTRVQWQKALVEAGPIISPVSENWWPKGLPNAGTETQIFYWNQPMRPSELAREYATHLAVRNSRSAARRQQLDRVEQIARTEAERLGKTHVLFERLTWCARRSVGLTRVGDEAT